jgi:protein TonB
MSTLALARPPVSPLRIAGFTGALALHLAALALLVLPPSLMLGAIEEKPADFVVDFIVAAKPPPPIPVPPVPPPPVRPAPTPRTTAPVVVPVVIAESNHQIAAPVADPVPDSLGEPVVDARPTLATAAALAYDDVPPPPYPAMARKRNWQGEVLLRVRVNEAGQPVAVEIAKSSGHRLLDRTARDHVLRRWRFQPALIEGRAVAAWALVPLNFRIEAG